MHSLFLFKYGKANRSEDNCHWKDCFLLTVPKGWGPHRGNTRGVWRWRSRWRAFVAVFLIGGEAA